MVSPEVAVAIQAVIQMGDVVLRVKLKPEETREVQMALVGLAMTMNQSPDNYLPIERCGEIAKDLVDQMYRAQAIDAKRK